MERRLCIIMKLKQKESIARMRMAGYSYSQVSKELDISQNTIQSYCRRNGLGGVGTDMALQKGATLCQNCDAPLIHTAGAKKKRFCSEKCRMTWWNAHPEAVNRKALYTFHCAYCGGSFESYGNRKRKYCSRSCYGKSKVIGHE